MFDVQLNRKRATKFLGARGGLTELAAALRLTKMKCLLYQWYLKLSAQVVLNAKPKVNPPIRCTLHNFMTWRGLWIYIFTPIITVSGRRSYRSSKPMCTWGFQSDSLPSDRGGAPISIWIMDCGNLYWVLTHFFIDLPLQFLKFLDLFDGRFHFPAIPCLSSSLHNNSFQPEVSTYPRSLAIPRMFLLCSINTLRAFLRPLRSFDCSWLIAFPISNGVEAWRHQGERTTF